MMRPSWLNKLFALAEICLVSAILGSIYIGSVLGWFTFSALWLGVAILDMGTMNGWPWKRTEDV